MDILSKKWFTYCFSVVVILIIISLYMWSISKAPSKFELYVFNTKGKPSIFIRTPQDERVLINGGANSDIIRFITKVIPFYSRRIDTIMLTDDGADEVTGLIDIVNRYKVSSVVVPALTVKKLGLASSSDQIYETFIDSVNVLSIPIKAVAKSDKLNFKGFKISILFPEDEQNFTYSKASAPELVLKISYGATSFLLTGHTSTKIQKFIAQNRLINTQANVLITSHSASVSSLSLDLVHAVRPEFVVYSQSVTSTKSSGKKSGTASKSKKVDPLYMILNDRRYNVQQKNTVKVFSDGKSVQIE